MLITCRQAKISMDALQLIFIGGHVGRQYNTAYLWLSCTRSTSQSTVPGLVYIYYSIVLAI